jgi:hypothetical protein
MIPVNLCTLSELKSESVSEINRNSVRIEIGIGVRNEPEQSPEKIDWIISKKLSVSVFLSSRGYYAVTEVEMKIDLSVSRFSSD